MRFFSFAVVAALVAPILAGPIALKTVETAKQRKEGSYIITLKPNVQKAAHLDKLQGKFRGTESVVSADWDADFLNGFAAKLTPEALKELRADPDVASISEDGIMSITTTQV
jgi:cerevisin